jgi:hypothetical protein
MLRRATIILASLLFALLCTIAAFISYMTVTVIWLDRIHFFSYYTPLAHLLCSLVALALAILLFLRKRDIAALLFLIGMIAALGDISYYCFVSFGMMYHWFRGFGPFPPQDHPPIDIMLYTFEVLSLLAYVGIFWISQGFARKHLTSRWS